MLESLSILKIFMLCLSDKSRVEASAQTAHHVAVLRELGLRLFFLAFCLLLLGFLDRSHLRHHLFGVEPLLIQELLALLLKLLRNSLNFRVVLQLQSLNAGFDVFLLESCFVEKVVVLPSLFGLDHRVDHFRLQTLGPNRVKHFLLCLKLRLFKPSSGIDALLTGEFGQLAGSQTVANGLDFFLDDRSLRRFHHISVHRFIEDILWHLERLVEPSVNDLSRLLLEGRRLPEELRVSLFVFLPEALAALLSVLAEHISGVIEHCLLRKFNTLDKIVERESAVGLVLGLTVFQNTLNHGVHDFFGRCACHDLLLAFALHLDLGHLDEALDLLVILDVVLDERGLQLFRLTVEFLTNQALDLGNAYQTEDHELLV